MNTQIFDKPTLSIRLGIWNKHKLTLFPLTFFPDLTAGFTTVSDGYGYAFNFSALQTAITTFTGNSLTFSWDGTHNVSVTDGLTTQNLVVYAGHNSVTT